jgi:hypothetical protein
MKILRKETYSQFGSQRKVPVFGVMVSKLCQNKKGIYVLVRRESVVFGKKKRQ